MNQNENFFIEPPFSYRPSVAQFLSRLKVDRSAFIADILHLDHKKNLNIERYEEDCLTIRLLTTRDLDYAEKFVWDYLWKKSDNGIVKFNPKKISRFALMHFSLLVRMKTAEKLNSFGGLRIMRVEMSNKFYIMQIIGTAVFGFFALALSWFFGFLFIAIGLRKFSNAKSEIRTFFKHFWWRYIKLNLLVYALFLPFLASISFVFLLFSLSTNVSFLLVALIQLGFLVLFFPLMLFILYSYGRFSADYLGWLFENPKAAEHRAKWLEFKAFLFDYSELENKPLKYYETWGKFYYYALAVGAIKKPEVT